MDAVHHIFQFDIKTQCFHLISDGPVPPVTVERLPHLHRPTTPQPSIQHISPAFRAGRLHRPTPAKEMVLAVAREPSSLAHRDGGR